MKIATIAFVVIAAATAFAQAPAALDAKVNLLFNHATLAQALDGIGHVAGLTIIVDDSVGAGVRDTIVPELRLRDVSARNALQFIVDQGGLTYTAATETTIRVEPKR